MVEFVNVERLAKAIIIWETVRDSYQWSMKGIREKHRWTWWARKEYWKNEKMYHKYFTGVIRRRIELQTAIKNQKES